MIRKVARKLTLAILCFSSLPAFADSNSDPCVGPTAMLSLVDRPTLSDSTCTIPYKKAMLEMGTQYQKLYPGQGYQFNLPEAELRIGLPHHTEFVIVMPDYIHQTVAPHSGNTSTVIGIKHRVSSSQKLQTAVESLFTLPTGSSNLGSQSLGVNINGILSYNATPALNFTVMLGASTLSSSRNKGGTYWTSFNPDVVVTWSANNKTDLYVEAYGESKVGPGMGAGFNSDVGVIYLLLPNMTVDAEVGQRISGQLGGFSRYVGTGMALAFG